MRTKRILAAVLTAIMIALIPISSMADTLGWKGSDSSGWRYYTSSGSYVKNDWKKIDGNWYYFDSKGYMESGCYRDGYWLNERGAYDPNFNSGVWKSDSTGWWYEDDGWYPVSSWLRIDGDYYYFDSDGYMEHECYRDGCWLTKSGARDSKYCNGTWRKNSVGWWYEDNGWYPKNKGLWIDGEYYQFDSSGYWKQDTSSQSSSTHYVLNTNSMKFHRPSCSSAGKIADYNRWDYYGSYEEVIDMGYSPCKVCKPK